MLNWWPGMTAVLSLYRLLLFVQKGNLWNQ